MAKHHKNIFSEFSILKNSQEFSRTQVETIDRTSVTKERKEEQDWEEREANKGGETQCFSLSRTKMPE